MRLQKIFCWRNFERTGCHALQIQSKLFTQVWMYRKVFILHFWRINMWIIKLGVRLLLFNHFPVIFRVRGLRFTFSCWFRSELLPQICWVNPCLSLTVVKILYSFLCISIFGRGVHRLRNSDRLLNSWELSLRQARAWLLLPDVLVLLLRYYSYSFHSRSLCRGIFLLDLVGAVYYS